MAWLDNISVWTVGAVGLGWLVLATGLALALGRVMGKTRAAAAQERQDLAASQPAAPEVQFHDPWLVGEVDDTEEDYGSRASSGTRFKPVVLDDEAVEPLRRAR
jgi:hypothetical protein